MNRRSHSNYLEKEFFRQILAVGLDAQMVALTSAFSAANTGDASSATAVNAAAAAFATLTCGWGARCNQREGEDELPLGGCVAC